MCISQSSLPLCLGLHWRAVLACVDWMSLGKCKLRESISGGLRHLVNVKGNGSD